VTGSRTSKNGEAVAAPACRAPSMTCTVVVNCTLWPVHATDNDPKDVLTPPCDKDTKASRTSKPSRHSTEPVSVAATALGKRCVLVDPHDRSLGCRTRRRTDQEKLDNSSSARTFLTIITPVAASL
jgi:hypothetical protein